MAANAPKRAAANMYSFSNIRPWLHLQHTRLLRASRETASSGWLRKAVKSYVLSISFLWLEDGLCMLQTILDPSGLKAIVTRWSRDSSRFYFSAHLARVWTNIRGALAWLALFVRSCRQYYVQGCIAEEKGATRQSAMYSFLLQC